MSHVPHTLIEEFPDHVDGMRSLKQADAHFERLAREYDEVNRTLHKAETNVSPVSDLEVLRMRKERMHLKDQISRYLRLSD